jgi:hypothetical protein
LQGHADSGPDELRRVLAAASAPAEARELAGEQAAVAQFRASYADSVQPVRRRSVIKTAAAKVIGAKVVLGAALAALATGGVAVAAATDHLPGPGSHHSQAGPAAESSHVRQVSPSTPTTPSGQPTPTGPRGQSGTHPSSSHASAASPSPSLVGLCTAYEAKVADNPGKALTGPAFTALITAAGGSDNVAAFCVTVLGDGHPTGSPSHPTGSPTTHPTPPTTYPTPPTTHPTGSPSTPAKP